MTLNTNERKLISIVSLTLGVLLIIASLFDQQISNIFANQNSIFGTIFQNYGMFPEGLILFISAEIIAFGALKKEGDSWMKIVITIIGLLVAFYALFQMVDGWMYYTASSQSNIANGLPIGTANNDDGGEVVFSKVIQLIITAVIWLVGTFISYIWINKKDNSQIAHLIKVAILGIAFYFVADEFISVMKQYWGRFRPYEIAENVDGAHFTNWWVINGETGHKSFPSGHTFAGMCAIFLPFFVDRKNVKLQKIMTYGGFLFGILMGFSRVRIGAHWLSDTVVSATITFFIAFLFGKLFGINMIEDDNSIEV